MDDFQVGLISGDFRDEFYESFQAPKFYDFRNPQDPDNIDDWFLTRASIKESFSEIIGRSKAAELTEDVFSVAAVTKPPKGPPVRSFLKTKEKLLTSSSGKFDQCSENDDPNQATALEAPEVKEARPEAGRKVETLRKNLKGTVAESPAKSRITRSTVPATVPQQKVLGSRKVGFGFKQYVRDPNAKATKALFGESQRPEAQATAPALKTDEGNTDAKLQAGQPNPEKFSSEFQESCRISGDTPACKRAIVSSSDYVVEQATVLESAMKLLKLGEDEKEICTEVLGVVCETAAQLESVIEVAESKTDQRPEQPVFSFRAKRDDKAREQKRTMQGKKRKSVEMSAKIKIAPATFVPLPATKLAVGNSKKLKLTCPQPFRLRTEERGALKEVEFSKKVEEYAAMNEALCMPPLPKKVHRKPRKTFRTQEPLKRSSETRVPNAIELSIEMLTIEKQQEQTVVEKTKPIRKLAVPSFERPFRPQRSTKKLTVPVEPKFHNIHGSRTCTKHQPMTTQ